MTREKPDSEVRRTIVDLSWPEKFLTRNQYISPFMTREKPDSEVRRTIVDLSWPEKFSVNVGVPKNTYLGSNFVLNYPSVDDIAKKIIELGPGSLLYKVDIS